MYVSCKYAHVRVWIYMYICILFTQVLWDVCPAQTRELFSVIQHVQVCPPPAPLSLCPSWYSFSLSLFLRLANSPTCCHTGTLVMYIGCSGAITTCIWVFGSFADMYVHACICIYANTQTHRNTHKLACRHIHKHEHTNATRYTCTYSHTHTYVCTHAYTHTTTNTHTHTNTHTQTHTKKNKTLALPLSLSESLS